ncbi:MAG: hypothetical protein MH825_08155 [Cyanobacteria bacterium]|nr:hypothetical protein [Cyanobacteriota bacterium]
MKTKADAIQVLVVRQLDQLCFADQLDWSDIELLRGCVMLYAYKNVLSAANPIDDAIENISVLINEKEQSKGDNPIIGLSDIELKAMKAAMGRIKRLHETKTKKALERTPGYLQLGF